MTNTKSGPLLLGLSHSKLKRTIDMSQIAEDLNVQPVILSGGSGTRLWPMSREKYPKQLLPLFGEDSLLQGTVRRLDGIAGLTLAPTMVVCNEEYRFVIAEQLRVMGKEGVIVLEPTARNTAPALTLAALEAESVAGDPVLLVMPADHIILDNAAFQLAVRQGASLAAAGIIVTFGITPDCPETGYGYIQTGEPLPQSSAFALTRFVENLTGTLHNNMWMQATIYGIAVSLWCAPQCGYLPWKIVDQIFWRHVKQPGRASSWMGILYAWVKLSLPVAQAIRLTTR